MAEVPLVILLVKWILKFIGYVCALVALPFTLYSLVVKYILEGKRTFDDNVTIYALLWIPRWLVLTGFFPFFFLEVFGLAYGVSMVASGGIAAVAGLAFALVTIIGVLFTRFDSFLGSVVPKIAYTGEFGYNSGVLDSQVDLMAALCVLFSLGGVIRIPFMTWALINADQIHRRRRSEFFLQFLMTFVDLFTLPFLIAVCVCFWRIPTLLRKGKKNTNQWSPLLLNHSLTIRGTIIAQFFNALIDIPFFLCGALFIVAFWRLPTVWEEVSKKPTLNKKRAAWNKQLGLMFLDIFCLFLGLIVAATIYRLPALVYNLKDQDTAGKRRESVCRQFGFIVFDLICILCTICLIAFFFYRFIAVIRRIPGRSWGFVAAGPGRQCHANAQEMIFSQFGKLLADFPFLIMGAFVTCLLWRIPFMWKDILSAERTSQRRKAVARHFGYLFLDVVDFPFVIASLIILVTGWRAYPLWKGISDQNKSRNKKRLFVMNQFGLWLLDVPTLLAAFILMITVYRAKYTIDGLKAVWFTKPQPPPAAPDPDLEDNPAPPPRYTSWHKVVGIQFGALILDIPFPILMALTLWRFYWCCKRVLKECETARERRVMILRYLWATLKDVPCSILFVIILCSLWRTYSLWRLYKDYNRGDNEHRLLLNLFGRTIADIPFVFMGLFVSVFVWRGIFFAHAILFEHNSDKENRKLAAQYFLALLGDIAICLMGTLIVGTLWRIPTCYCLIRYSLRTYAQDDRWRHSKSILYSELRTVRFIISDILTMLQICVVIGGVFHINSLLTRAYKATKIHGGSKVYDSTARRDYQECLSYFEDEEERGLPLSLSFYRPLVMVEFADALRHMPHLFLLPVKLAGVIFLPIHLYLKYRISHQAKLQSPLFTPKSSMHSDIYARNDIPLSHRRPSTPSTPHTSSSSTAPSTAPSSPPTTPPSTSQNYSGRPPLSPPSHLYTPSLRSAASPPSSTEWPTTPPSENRPSSSEKAVDEPRPQGTSPGYLRRRHSFDSNSSRSTRHIKRYNSDMSTDRKDSSYDNLDSMIGSSGQLRNPLVHAPFNEDTNSIDQPAQITNPYRYRDMHTTPSLDFIVEENVETERSGISSGGNSRGNGTSESARTGEKSGAEDKSSEKNVELGSGEEKALTDTNYSLKKSSSINSSINMDNNHTNNHDCNSTSINMNGDVSSLNSNYQIEAGLGVEYVTESSSSKRLMMKENDPYYDGADVAAPVKRKRTSPSMSFLQYPMLWLHTFAAPRMNFWGMDQFFILNLVAFAFVLTNELAMIPLCINLASIFVLTLGSPLWTHIREANGWVQLGEAQGLMVPIEIALLLIQSVFFPVFLFVQFIILFFPIFLISASHFPGSSRWPPFDRFWNDFFTTSSYWRRFSEFEWWFWLLEIYWLVVFIATLHLTMIYSKKLMPLFNPLSAYYWLIKRVVAGRMWKAYRKLLEVPTRWCYRHRKTMGCLGELIMFPLFLAWVGWPIIIPIFTNYYVFLAAGAATGFLVFKGYFLVKECWDDPKAKVEDSPQLSLLAVNVEIPATGGIIFTITGNKDVNFTLKQAKWFFVGKELWSALGEVFGHGVISGIKMTLHPIDLCPAFMSPDDLAIGKREFVMCIRAGTVNQGKVLKHSTIMKKLKLIVSNGDPTFKMLFEYGFNRFGWKKSGTLCFFETKVSDILRAATSGESLIPVVNLPELPELPPPEVPRFHLVQIPNEPVESAPPSNQISPRSPGRTPRTPNSLVPSSSQSSNKTPRNTLWRSPSINRIDEGEKSELDEVLALADFRDDPLRVSAVPVEVEHFPPPLQLDPNTLVDDRVLEFADAMNVDYGTAEQAIALYEGDLERAADYLLSNSASIQRESSRSSLKG